MTGERGPWRIERREDVRQDAPGYFVPIEDLPQAQVGDAVVVTSADGQERTGRVGDIVDDAERGRFAAVTFE